MGTLHCAELLSPPRRTRRRGHQRFMRRNRDGFSARKEFNASEKKTDAEAMMVMAKLFPAKDQVKRSFRGKRAVGEGCGEEGSPEDIL